MLAGVLQPRLQGAPPLAHQHLGPALGRGGLTIRQLGQELLLLAQHRAAPAVAQIGRIVVLATSARVPVIAAPDPARPESAPRRRQSTHQFAPVLLPRPVRLRPSAVLGVRVPGVRAVRFHTRGIQ